MILNSSIYEDLLCEDIFRIGDKYCDRSNNQMKGIFNTMFNPG